MKLEITHSSPLYKQAPSHSSHAGKQSSAVSQHLSAARQTPQQAPSLPHKQARALQFTYGKGMISLDAQGGPSSQGRLHTFAKPFSAAHCSHQAIAWNAEKHLSPSYHAFVATAGTMAALIKEGEALKAQPASTDQAEIRLAQLTTEPLRRAVQGKMSVLAPAITLQRAQNQTLTHSAAAAREQWVAQHDQPGTYVVLNGNNDERYVHQVGATLANSQHIQFITSGFGGHGTTEKFPISLDKTEGDRFKEILLSHGIAAERVLVDPFSTNSGQNAANVGQILSSRAQQGLPVRTIVVAGTPAAVFRQTYTYAQQMKFDAAVNFSSFPFVANGYDGLSDHLAAIREFTTTMNYLANTAYLPADRQLYPRDFFAQAIDALKTYGTQSQQLELGQSAAAVGFQVGNTRYEARQALELMAQLDPDLASRFTQDQLTPQDKENLKVMDGYFRALFVPLELSFKREDSQALTLPQG